MHLDSTQYQITISEDELLLIQNVVYLRQEAMEKMNPKERKDQEDLTSSKELQEISLMLSLILN